jgi:hypothetical protein
MSLKNLWNKWGYFILLFISILIILICSLIKKDKKDDPNFVYKNFKPTISKKRSPPTESKGEIECKRVMEKLYNKPFLKIRPHFMINTQTGKNLELDLYNPELKIAVEYSGQQHYKYIPYFHKNYQAFLDQKSRDEMKRDRCKEYGILLIEVPYTIDLSEIENFLIKELKKGKKIN